MADEFSLFLPSLLRHGLIEDNSKHYSLITYDRTAMSDAARLVVTSFGVIPSALPLDSKKRVKFLMEFLGVGLSLPIADHKVMRIALQVYRDWLRNPQLFGDRPRQSKYLRRIILQLTLPFAFRDAADSPEFREFAPLLDEILDHFQELHMKRTNLLDDETWLVLFHSCLGICDSLFEFQFPADYAEKSAPLLRQKGLRVLLNVLYLRRFRDDTIWQRFSTFSKRWSRNVDFVHVWGRWIDDLFKLMNARILHLEIPEEDYFYGGAYSPTDRIEESTIAMIFHHTIFAIGYDGLASDPGVMAEIALSIAGVRLSAEHVARSESKLFVNRYPARGFLKLFGPCLTFAPVLPNEFDFATSVNVDTIMQILAKFDTDGLGDVVKRMIAYVAKRVTPQNPQTVGVFLLRANPIFGFHAEHSTFLARFAFELIRGFDYQQGGDTSKTIAFERSVCGLFGSVLEIIGGDPGMTEAMTSAFRILWKNTKHIAFQFLLLMPMWRLPEVRDQVLITLFEEVKSARFLGGPEGVNFLAGCITLISVSVRSDPAEVDAVVRDRLVPRMVEALWKFHVHANVLVAALLLLKTIVEWGDRALLDLNTLTVVFVFTHWVEGQIAQKGEQIPPASQNILRELIAAITARINIHMPANDHFSRQLNSSRDVSEAAAIALSMFKNPKTHR
jgi:hypothetical protein